MQRTTLSPVKPISVEAVPDHASGRVNLRIDEHHISLTGPQLDRTIRSLRTPLRTRGNPDMILTAKFRSRGGPVMIALDRPQAARLLEYFEALADGLGATA